MDMRRTVLTFVLAGSLLTAAAPGAALAKEPDAAGCQAAGQFAAAEVKEHRPFGQLVKQVAPVSEEVALHKEELCP